LKTHERGVATTWLTPCPKSQAPNSKVKKEIKQGLPICLPVSQLRLRVAATAEQSWRIPTHNCAAAGGVIKGRRGDGCEA